MNSIKVCEYSRSRSFHDDLILQDQASGERSQDHWSSGFIRLEADSLVNQSGLKSWQVFFEETHAAAQPFVLLD